MNIFRYAPWVLMALLLVSCEKDRPLLALQMLPGAVQVKEVNLLDHRGAQVDAEGFRGVWQLVFFGYTTCPDICPLELQKLASLLRTFEENGEDPPRVVFVSVDPERDRGDALSAYVGFFHPDILGLTGDNPALENFAGLFGASYSRAATIDGVRHLVKPGGDMPDGSGDYYDVNHTSRVFVIDPEGNYRGSFPPPLDVQSMYQDMLQVMP
jgi:protein SCO1/2